MKVEVELLYKSMPSEGELQAIKENAYTLASSRKSVSLSTVERDKYQVVVLRFEMRTQAQYKVVQEISDEVQRWLVEPMEDIVIQFL